MHLSNPMDLSECVDAVTGEDVTVVRLLPAQLVNGRKQKRGEEKRFKITMSVQPMTQRELQLLPEGERVQGAVKGYTEFRLMTAQQSECREPDRFEYLGVRYQVMRVDDWSDVANYFRVLGTRVDR